MQRDKTWQKLEDLIAFQLQEIDKFARHTKGSGNKNEKHDIKTKCGLAIECKERNLKSVYNEEWMQKIIEEVPLHSQDISILVTRNNENKIRVHLNAVDFFRLYIKLWKLEHGEK
jgi:hypothetical protein